MWCWFPFLKQINIIWLLILISFVRYNWLKFLNIIFVKYYFAKYLGYRLHPSVGSLIGSVYFPFYKINNVINHQTSCFVGYSFNIYSKFKHDKNSCIVLFWWLCPYVMKYKQKLTNFDKQKVKYTTRTNSEN